MICKSWELLMEEKTSSVIKKWCVKVIRKHYDGKIIKEDVIVRGRELTSTKWKVYWTQPLTPTTCMTNSKFVPDPPTLTFLHLVTAWVLKVLKHPNFPRPNKSINDISPPVNCRINGLMVCAGRILTEWTNPATKAPRVPAHKEWKD